MSKQSPTQRIIAQSTLYRMHDRGTPIRLQVKEPHDEGRAKLGKIIHDPSEANELWESRMGGQPNYSEEKKKKKPIINPPMSMEWSR